MIQAVLSRPIQEVAVSIQMQNGSNFEYSSILMVLIGSISLALFWNSWRNYYYVPLHVNFQEKTDSSLVVP